MSNQRNPEVWLNGILGPDTIKVDGARIAVARKSVNFVGATQTDDPDHDATNVSLPGGGAEPGGSEGQVQVHGPGNTLDGYDIVGTGNVTVTVDEEEKEILVHGSGGGGGDWDPTSPETLENKTISGADNTLSDIPGAAVIPDFSNQNVATTGNLLLGSTPRASTGLVRLPNGAHIAARNDGNNGDYPIVASGSSNTVYVGCDGTFSSAYMAGQLRLYAVSTVYLGWGNGGSTGLSVGTGGIEGYVAFDFRVGGATSIRSDGTALRTGIPLAGNGASSVPFRFKSVEITKSNTSSLTLGGTQYECPLVKLVGTPGGAFQVNFPSTVGAPFVVVNETDQSMDVGADFSLAPDEAALMVHDGNRYRYVKLT